MRLFATRSTFPTINIIANKKDDKDGDYITVVRNFSTIGKDAGSDYPDLTPSCLINLSRLGLVLLPDQTSFGAPFLVKNSLYKPLEEAPEVKEYEKQIKEMEGYEMKIEQRIIEISSLGKQFCKACVLDKNVIEADSA